MGHNGRGDVVREGALRMIGQVFKSHNIFNVTIFSSKLDTKRLIERAVVAGQRGGRAHASSSGGHGFFSLKVLAFSSSLPFSNSRKCVLILNLLL